MKTSKILFLLLMLNISGISGMYAQSASTSSTLVAQPVTDRTVTFDYSGSGVAKPMIWGMDAGGWTSPVIWTTGIGFLGAENIKITRIPAFPTDEIVGGALQQRQKDLLNDRLNQAGLVGRPLQVMLNPGGGEIPWYSRDAVGYARYAQLMELTKQYIESFGHTVVSITGYNEPDYWANGATMQNFYSFIAACKSRPGLSGLRFCGGNTLNNDFALDWYNYVKPAGLTEGNTHQLAGGFDSYANFYTTVRANGHYASNDEVHNIMESIVGAEYGMQAGIFWGYANLARGEFVKACNGVRLGYAEHRPNWTAAAVYRNAKGQVQAFGGASERQAATTTYRYVSKDRDVYYEGYGPQREYTLEMPGGSGYMTNDQPYAERVINISSGDDIQPPVNGTYILVNRMSSKAMEVLLSSTANGASIAQRTYKGTTNQQWTITPVSSRIGGDFSYFTIANVNSKKVPDIMNFSLDNGARIVQWDDLKGGNQQWYFEYVEDGWFYIRSRHSSKCIEVSSPYTLDGAAIQQGAVTGATNQQWRLLPVDAAVEFIAPAAPAGLTATANAASVRLEWTANTESDLSGYTIFRSDTAGRAYQTIARNVKTTSLVDNTAAAGKQYFYRLRATDKSLNRSAYSDEVAVAASGGNAQVAHYRFEGNTLDSTLNLNHSATYGTVAYPDGKFSTKGISLNGTNTFVQLPATVANHKDITIAAWVYPRTATAWQRIFDFGNDMSQNMFLTTRSAAGQLRFAIKNGGDEQGLNAAALPLLTWSHVAVTLSTAGARMYVNGSLVAESNTVTISPLDFKPVLNYIGRSQYPDPLLNGIVDDFRVYNYALTSGEVAQISSPASGLNDPVYTSGRLRMYPVPANDVFHVRYDAANNRPSVLSIVDMNGKTVLHKNMDFSHESELNVSNLPSGIYVIKVTNNEETITDKLIIKRE